MNSRMLRILMIGAYPAKAGKPQGGVEAATEQLVRALSELRNVEVKVMALRDVAQTPGVVPPDRAEVHYVNVGRLDMRGLVRLAKTIRSEVSAHSSDVVHVQGSAGLAFLLQRKLTVPVVLTVHGLAERDALFLNNGRHLRALYFALTERQARRRVKNVIAISNYTKLQLRESGQRIWEIGNAIHPVFSQGAARPSSGMIVFAGRVRPIKNVTSLIEAFAQISDYDAAVTLLISGDLADGAYYQKCLRIVSRRGLGRRVAFTGELEPAELAGLLKSAACFVLPSLQENAPMAISEAAATGVPIVATDVGDVASMLQGYDQGYVVSTGDAQSLARGLRKALAHGERADPHSPLVVRHQGEYVARQTLEVYRSVMQTKGR